MTLGMYLSTVSLCGMAIDCRIPDNWQLACMGFYLGWLVLDNIDGKQARRTGTSSPLGLLFDHQVDALMATISSVYFATVLMAGDKALLIWVTATVPFYLAMWEEAYTGSLDFPLFSGASDGCVILAVFGFVFYWITPEALISMSLGGIQLRFCFLYFSIFVSCCISIY